MKGYFFVDGKDIAHAEDGKLSTYAYADRPNIDLYVNHPYTNEEGACYWNATYGSSGTQNTTFTCYNHDANKWELVWYEPNSVSSKTVEHKIPASCLKPGEPIQLKIQSATWSRYYEGYIIRK